MQSAQYPCRHAEHSVHTEGFRTHCADSVWLMNITRRRILGICHRFHNYIPAPCRVTHAHAHRDHKSHESVSPSTRWTLHAMFINLSQARAQAPQRIVDRARPPLKTGIWQVIPCWSGCPPLDDAVWLASACCRGPPPGPQSPCLTSRMRVPCMDCTQSAGCAMGCTPAAGLLAGRRFASQSCISSVSALSSPRLEEGGVVTRGERRGRRASYYVQMQSARQA